MSSVFKNWKFLLGLVFFLFVILRLLGLGLPYYQDENHWPGIGSAGLESLGGFVHPPLTSLIFIASVRIFGPDHLRFLPFIFGIINFWLLFFLVRYRFSLNRALWSLLFFSVGFYSVLASLMVDTDGQILPFFFLLSAISYYKWQDGAESKNKIIWGSILAVSIFLGFLTKASFVLAFGAIILDFLYSQYRILSRQKLFKIALIALGSLILIFFLILGIMYILPNANVLRAISYWKHFAVFFGRNYMQILIQFLKALLYASPLLLAPLLFLTKDLVRKLRLFIIFLILGLIFYLILFDFSSGALDRYFQFIIVPLAVISGVVIGNTFESPGAYNKRRFMLLGCVIGLVLFLAQFLPHFVPALYPKADWFSRALSFRWNFLFPFTGGSGPMGFYISWLFVASIWLAAIILAIAAFTKIKWRKPIWIIILVLGFIYNGVFIEEYLFGKINGSSVVLLKNAVVFIKNNKNISRVITYNNIGNRELDKIGKYERRLYVAPKFESGYIDILKNFKGHYLVIDIPRLDSNGLYSKYFSSCKIIYEENSKKISAKIYDCKKAKNISL